MFDWLVTAGRARRQSRTRASARGRSRSTQPPRPTRGCWPAASTCAAPLPAGWDDRPASVAMHGPQRVGMGGPPRLQCMVSGRLRL